MDHIIRLALLIMFPCSSFAQEIHTDTTMRPARYVLWITPSVASHIHGIAIGPISSVHVCNEGYTQISNGINIELIGLGFITLFNSGKLMKMYEELDPDTNHLTVLHNGILFSALGTFDQHRLAINGVSLNGLANTTARMNGLSISSIMSMIYDQRGASISLLNFNQRTKGIQIGIFNNSHELRGLQLGLWNTNQHRSLPILNWGTRRSTDKQVLN